MTVQDIKIRDYRRILGGAEGRRRVKLTVQPLTSMLIQAAVQSAREAGAPAVEAYPVDTEKPKSTRNIFVGTASTFARAGFKRVARRKPDRPIVRHDLTRQV